MENLVEFVFRLFERLRVPLRLGINDLKEVLDLINEGQGLENIDDLSHLFNALWTNSMKDQEMLNKVFVDLVHLARVYEPVKATSPKVSKKSENLTSIAAEQKKVRRKKPSMIRKVSHPVQSIALAQTKVNEKMVYDHLSSSEQHHVNPTYRPKLVSPNRRKVQGWFSKVQDCEDLDVSETISQISTAGMVLRPVYQQLRKDYRLLLLIDASDSLMPFSEQKDRFLKSIENDKLPLSALYYFRNTPKQHLYTSKILNNYVKVDTLWKQYYHNTIVVIISDAGVMRWVKKSSRKKSTKDFLLELKSHYTSIIWFNPTPPQRWHNDICFSIRQELHIPMFELSEKGLSDALKYLSYL